MNIFLSKYQNKTNKQGIVNTLPASFRSALSRDNFNIIIIYPVFKKKCIESFIITSLQEIYGIIQKLYPCPEGRDDFETIVMEEFIQLPFHQKGRVVIPAHLTQQVGNFNRQACFVGKKLIFEIWNLVAFERYLKIIKAVAQSNRFSFKNQQNVALEV